MKLYIVLFATLLMWSCSEPVGPTKSLTTISEKIREIAEAHNAEVLKIKDINTPEIRSAVMMEKVSPIPPSIAPWRARLDKIGANLVGFDTLVNDMRIRSKRLEDMDDYSDTSRVLEQLYIEVFLASSKLWTSAEGLAWIENNRVIDLKKTADTSDGAVWFGYFKSVFDSDARTAVSTIGGLGVATYFGTMIAPGVCIASVAVPSAGVSAYTAISTYPSGMGSPNVPAVPPPLPTSTSRSDGK
jgi:hypothetical protein